MYTGATHRLATRYVLSVLVLFCLVQTYASATFVTYSDRAAFLADAATASLTTTNEDFSTNPGDPFTISDGSNSVELDILVGSHSGGLLTSVTSTGFFETVNVELGSSSVVGSVVGIGFDFILNGVAIGSLLRLGINGLPPIEGPFGQIIFGNFLGLLSVDDMTISSVDSMLVSLTSQQNFQVTSQIDNVVIATSSAPVIPEPGTLVLFAAGILGVLCLGYMRKRRQSGSV
jgi:hypothetical protein